ncbi:MAG: hypothetical protein L3J83_04995 [Proteobacteria bacterium]|nr:hypothetical protein [Pseudomonadota bacterium]
MKKSIILIVSILMFLTHYVQSQCVSCNNNDVDFTKFASAVGQNNLSRGQASFAMGNASQAKGISSGAFGTNAEAWAGESFAIGRKIRVIGSSSIVLGCGYLPSDYLINGKAYTLMIGFNSTAPTFFVSESNTDALHKDRTGRIGIGNVTTPQTKLHIKADDNEDAELFLQSYFWGSNTTANIYIGNLNHGIAANGRTGLVFNSENNYVFGIGNVGIGIEEPLEKLEVNGTVLTTGFKMPQQELRDGWVLTADETGRALWAPSQNLWYQTETNDVYRPVGNVGIGVDNPLSKLEVVGQISIGYHVATVDRNDLIVEGMVGIGTFNPTEKLEVVGKIKTTEFQLLNGQLDGNILQCDNEGNAFWVDPSLINDGDWTLFANNIYVESNRKVGIGTSTPTQPLDVVGNIKVSGNIIGGHNGWPPLKLFAGTNENDGAYISMSSNHDETASIKLLARGTNGRIEFHNHTHQVMSIKGDGNIYMGAPNNTTELFVNGEINAHLVRVKNDIPWWDGVFDESYNLMPFDSLESFINENHHLPDMPTEEQVHEDGLDLAQMNALLLKKLEELTLYVIELKKENEEIREEIEIIKGE